MQRIESAEALVWRGAHIQHKQKANVVSLDIDRVRCPGVLWCHCGDVRESHVIPPVSS
jgi:hypothetical protein